MVSAPVQSVPARLKTSSPKPNSPLHFSYIALSSKKAYRANAIKKKRPPLGDLFLNFMEEINTCRPYRGRPQHCLPQREREYLLRCSRWSAMWLQPKLRFEAPNAKPW